MVQTTARGIEMQPNRVYLVAESKISIGEQLGKRGRKGSAYRVIENRSIAAKIYYDPPSDKIRQKLDWMIANPPAIVKLDSASPVLAWPKAIITDDLGNPVGFTMPVIEDSWDIARVYDPALRDCFRRQSGTKLNWRHLHEVARNLSMVVQNCHDAGYVIGDLNNNNIRVKSNGHIALIDIDSIQVSQLTPRGTVWHYCTEYFPDYLAPELKPELLTNTPRKFSSDNYILAVLIFRLLQNGVHPFSGKTSDFEPPEPQSLAQRGHYPYDVSKIIANIAPHPDAPPIVRLHPDLIQLFQRAFQDGPRNPDFRPTGEKWEKSLTTSRLSLKECVRGHIYSTSGLGICLQNVRSGFCGSDDCLRTLHPIPLSELNPITGQWSLIATSALRGRTTTTNISTPVTVKTSGAPASKNFTTTKAQPISPLPLGLRDRIRAKRGLLTTVSLIVIASMTILVQFAGSDDLPVTEGKEGQTSQFTSNPPLDQSSSDAAEDGFADKLSTVAHVAEGGSSSEFATGGTATITEDRVNVRSEPSTSSEVVTALATGEIVEITGESHEADSYTWWPIETADGSTGWIAEDFLQS